MSRKSLQELHHRLTHAVIGAGDASDLLLTALLARGHILIEGAPGIGKTSLGHTLATAMGGIFKRVQFTPDLVPTDLVGFSLYRPKEGEFEFIAGPLFSNFVLADEINRASPRVQSALLESMNEGRVTVDGVTRSLPNPFMVIATRNELDAIGTFPMPEAQLDRFLLSASMSLPSFEEQTQIILAHAEGRIGERISDGCVIDLNEIEYLQAEVSQVSIAQSIAQYITALCENLRRQTQQPQSVSVRASLAIMKAARAHAYLKEAKAVYPDHVQAVFGPVMRHRVGSSDPEEASLWIEAVLKQTAVP